MVKSIVDKWFYVYGILSCIHSDKGCCFENEVMGHLYAMYGVKKSTTTPYQLHSNSQCKRFRHMLNDLLKTVSKEKKSNWPLHLISLVLVCNLTPCSITG